MPVMWKKCKTHRMCVQMYLIICTVTPSWYLWWYLQGHATDSLYWQVFYLSAQAVSTCQHTTGCKHAAQQMIIMKVRWHSELASVSKFLVLFTPHWLNLSNRSWLIIASSHASSWVISSMPKHQVWKTTLFDFTCVLLFASQYDLWMASDKYHTWEMVAVVVHPARTGKAQQSEQAAQLCCLLVKNLQQHCW